MSKKKLLWTAFLTISLVSNLFDQEKMSNNFDVFSKISTWIVVQNLALIAVIVGAYLALVTMMPFLKRTLYGKGTNLSLIPADVKYFGAIFLVLMIFSLPGYAHTEEEWFREGTLDWMHGLRLSITFGLVHCLVGVPFAAGLVISIAGLWFTHQYFVGGIELSTVHHTTYNLIIISTLFVAVIIQHIKKTKDKTPAVNEQQGA